jgi:hypothetical protein
MFRFRSFFPPDCVEFSRAPLRRGDACHAVLRIAWNQQHLVGLVVCSFGVAGARMRGENPVVGTVAAVAAVIVLTLGLAIDVALSENGQPPGQSQQPADNPAATPPGSPAVTVLNDHEVEGILGREVRSADDANMGRIVDVIVDRSGKVPAAIIDFGGFLGVGSRKIAVDWNALHFAAPGQLGERITLELTPDQVKAAPEYQEGKPVIVLGALGKLEPLPFE